MGPLQRWVRRHVLRQRQTIATLSLLDADGHVLATEPVELLGRPGSFMSSTHAVNFPGIEPATITTVLYSGPEGELLIPVAPEPPTPPT